MERTGLIETALTEAVDFLGALFGSGGLERLQRQAPDHPAVRQYQALDALRATRSVDRFSELELVAEVADYFLDFRMWPRSGTESFWDFIEAPAARKRVERNITIADRYEDTLAEVDTWAWLTEEGVQASLREDEGLPDIRIDAGGEPVWGEVKHVQVATTPANVGNAVTNANRQLRRASGESSGTDEARRTHCTIPSRGRRERFFVRDRGADGTAGHHARCRPTAPGWAI